MCAASLGASLLTLLAFPPFDLWPLVFLVPAPLLWAAEHTGERRLGAAIAAAIGAVPVWAWQQQWIFGISFPGGVLLVIYLSLYPGLLVWLASWSAARLRVGVWAIGPVLWVGLEVFRGAVLWNGYPWLLIAHPLVAWPWLSHAASVIGVYGVSLLTVALTASAWVAAFKRGRARRWGAGALAAVVAVWALLASSPRVAQTGELRVAVVQTNVPQSVKGGWAPPQRVRDLDRMLELTIRAAQSEPPPDLIVWPETMFPGAALDQRSLEEERRAHLIWYTDAGVAWPVLRHVVWLGTDGDEEPQVVSGPVERAGRLVIPTAVAADSLRVWQARLGVPMLVGAEGIDGLRLEVRDDGSIEERSDGRYNSTYLIRGGRALPDRYDKLHLTPFGETMPYISRWKGLESLFLRIGIGAAGMAFNLDPGERVVTHELDTDGGAVRIATPICFEGIMPGVCRRLAYAGGERRAGLFAQLTNEGWFGTFDAGREQHLQIVRWRAIELGIPLVRAANTGISAGVDADGRVIDRGVEGGPTNVDGVLWTTLPLTHGATIYGWLGDLVGWTCLGLSGLALGAAAFLGLRESRGRERSDIDKVG